MDAHAYVTLTLEEYLALPHAERTVLRRAAFGMAYPDKILSGYNLAALRDLLVAENERTGTFPEKWTHSAEDDEILDLLR